MQILKIIGGIVFSITAVYIIGYAVLVSYYMGDYFMLAMKIMFFPVTYFVYPFYSELWPVLLVSLIGFWLLNIKEK